MINLEPCPPPAPRPEPPACPSCRAFAPECMVPPEMFGGTGPAVAMCWLCAHAVVAHGASVEDAVARVGCRCAAEDVFPLDVLARRRPVVASGEVVVVALEPALRWRSRGRARVVRVGAHRATRASRRG